MNLEERIQRRNEEEIVYKDGHKGRSKEKKRKKRENVTRLLFFENPQENK